MGKRRRRGRPGGNEPLFESKPDLPPIDLHRHTLVEAERVVRNRIETLARTHRGALVHIVTGKGQNSSAGPVLRPGIERLLQGPLKVYISRFESDLDQGGFLLRLR